jgi:hypothetical protein
MAIKGNPFAATRKAPGRLTPREYEKLYRSSSSEDGTVSVQEAEAAPGTNAEAENPPADIAKDKAVVSPKVETNKPLQGATFRSPLRAPPVTVGKSPLLPDVPRMVDLTRDERFLARYWFDPTLGGLPRSQERFFHFYRFLYAEAARTGCARVFFTKKMISDALGDRARATFTKYRKLGEQYGMFTVHVVGNLGRRENQPGTYFYLRDPWKNSVNTSES